jgi:hypothetical protein
MVLETLSFPPYRCYIVSLIKDKLIVSLTSTVCASLPSTYVIQSVLSFSTGAI